MTTGQGIAILGVWIGAGIIGAASAFSGGDNAVLILPTVIAAAVATIFMS